MGPGQIFFTLVKLGQCFVAQARASQPHLVFRNFPYKSQIFQFFPFGSKKSHRVGPKNTGVKDWSAPYLLRVKSMLRLGQVRSVITDKTLI